MILTPKNWFKFQHYKNRCPPWIKLHRDLLTDREYICLPIASKALAPFLWLLASESKDGSFDASFDELQFRLHISKKEYEDGLKPLIDKGFFTTECNTLADRLQDAIPEREGETEKEKRQKATDVALLPDWIPLETWAAFLEMRKKIKKPPTAHAIQLLIAKLDKFRKDGQDVQAILEKSITSGWQDVFELREMAQKTFAQQAADIARTTVPAANTGPDPALIKIESDRQKAVPMPDHIRNQIRSVIRKV